MEELPTETLDDADLLAVLIIDSESTRILHANTAAELLLGYTNEELAQLTLGELKADEAKAGDSWQRLSNGGGCRLMLRSANGTPMELHAQSAGVPGQPAHTLVLLTHLANQETVESSSKTIEFTHQFNNALAVIQGNAEALLRLLQERRKTVSNATIVTGLEQVCEASRRATHLTRKLRALASHNDARPVLVSPRDVTEGLAATLLAAAGPRIDVSFEYSENVGLIFIDPLALERILLIMVRCACAPMTTEGRLKMSLLAVENDADLRNTEANPTEFIAIRCQSSRTPAPNAEFSSNKSSPIEPDIEELDSSVQQLGGKLLYNADAAATTITTVLLPRRSSCAAPESEAAAPDNRTVLICDDNESVRLMSVRFLSTAGYTVLAAASGQEALRILETRRDPIDLLLTDIMMPQMNGRQLADEFLKRSPASKVLFLSGYPPEALDQEFELHADEDFLEKPFTMGMLRKTVRRILDG